MNHKVLDKNYQNEITRLFTSVFTSSEGDEEGKLIGNLASELSSNIDNEEIVCLGTLENESLIGSDVPPYSVALGFRVRGVV